MVFQSRYKYLLIVIASISISCSTDVTPPSEISEDSFWETADDAYEALNACYSNMQSFNIYDEMASDNAHSHKPWEGPWELIQQNGISTENDYGYSFSSIRQYNNFINNIDKTEVSEELKERMKSEARFLRAFEYLDLTLKFGKVPIITSILEYDEDIPARDDIETVRSFILDELDEVSQILPEEYSGGYLEEKSRITSGAALTLLARAALYFEEYEIAENATKEVMESGLYQLFTLNSLNNDQQKEADEMEQFIDFDEKGVDRDKFVLGLFSYESLWHEDNANPDNPEFILTKEYMEDEDHMDVSRYIYLRPSQLVKGYSSFEPMPDLIDAYWDIDGKTIRTTDQSQREVFFENINEEVKDLSQNEYIAKVAEMDLESYDYMEEFRNRDSRLYASILFPFKGWHETDFGTFYYRWKPNWAGSDGNESWSGYSFRKMVALNSYLEDNSAVDYPVLRYAEVLLSFAEARIMTTGWDAEAQEAINKLRRRSGMPEAPKELSKDEAIDFIRNERRIELAGEGQRFFDIRRYGSDYANKVMNGKTLAPNGYKIVEKIWNDRLMLMPIPQSAIDLNPQLKDDQNPGY